MAGSQQNVSAATDMQSARQLSMVYGVTAALLIGIPVSALVYLFAGAIAHGAPLLGVVLAPGWVILGHIRIAYPMLSAAELVLIYSALQLMYYLLLGLLIPLILGTLRRSSTEK